MIELFDDFRDILVELHNAGARFVVLGGHAVAFHGHPRATKDLDVLVEANSENAKRVYAALAAFGAPLSAFEVGVEDFASRRGLAEVLDVLSARTAQLWGWFGYRGLPDAEVAADVEHAEHVEHPVPVVVGWDGGRPELVHEGFARG
jgi:hypothetical protein